MLYLTGENGLKIIVLETKNIEKIQKGQPAHTPDKSVLIAWTPDPEWLARKILEAGGDAIEIAKLIDEASKRPEKELRPYHEHTQHKLK